jgi:hypothetical protein
VAEIEVWKVACGHVSCNGWASPAYERAPEDWVWLEEL